VATGLLIAALLAVSGHWLPTLFSDNPDVTDVSTLFLMIAPISYGAYGMVMVMNASFNGMGKPMPAVHISVTRMAVIYVPLALIAERYFGIVGIFGAYAFANIVTGIVAYVWARASVQEQCDAHAEPLIVSDTA
jgi:Na+-driven multidrug efflux pump